MDVAALANLCAAANFGLGAQIGARYPPFARYGGFDQRMGQVYSQLGFNAAQFSPMTQRLASMAMRSGNGIRAVAGILNSDPYHAFTVERAKGAAGKSAPVQKTKQWTKIVVDFTTGPKTKLPVGAALGYYNEDVKGTAWFSELSLIELGQNAKK